MSVLYTPAAALLAALTLVPIQATAHWFDGSSCSLDFSGAVAVTPEVVRIHSNGSELIVTASNSLLVDGRVIDLNDAQRDRVAEYVGEIRTTMPDVVEVALEGVEIGLTAAAEVAGAVFGSRPPADLYVLMDEVRERVGQRMYDRDGSIYLNGDGINALDVTMARVRSSSGWRRLVRAWNDSSVTWTCGLVNAQQVWRRGQRNSVTTPVSCTLPKTRFSSQYRRCATSI